jgi:hypothetical protein
MSNSKELTNLILRPHESKDHEFKGAIAWNGTDKKSCCELVKDILAIANTKGGFLVIGVEETANGFSPGGLTSAQIASFQSEEINRFIQRYAEPPINTHLTKVGYDGKEFVVISIPQFGSIPHICKKDYPGVLTKPTLYVRTDNNESAPIATTSDFHALIEAAILKREQSLLTSIRTILKGPETGVEVDQAIEEQYGKQVASAINVFETKDPLKHKNYTGYREVTFFPSSYFNARRFDLSKLKGALNQASVDFKGWPFIFVSNQPKDVYWIQDGVESLISLPDFLGSDRTDFWRLYTSGLFYHRTLMWEESKDRERSKAIDINYLLDKGHKGPTMDFVSLICYVAEAVNALALLYCALGLTDEPITARFRILGTDNRLLTSYYHGHLRMPYVARIPEIIDERTFGLDEWRAGITDLSADIIKSIFLKFNWENSSFSVSKEYIEKLFSRKL